MSDLTKAASLILDTLCSACQKSVGCTIRMDGIEPNLETLPAEWHMGFCDEYLAVDTDTMDIFDG